MWIPRDGEPETPATADFENPERPDSRLVHLNQIHRQTSGWLPPQIHQSPAPPPLLCANRIPYMDAIRKIRKRNGSLVVSIPSQVARTCCMGRSPCVVLLPAGSAMFIRAYDPGFAPGPGDRASVRMVQSIRGTYFVTIPAGLVRALGLEAGQYLEFIVEGDQIRAGRADISQMSCAGAC